MSLVRTLRLLVLGDTWILPLGVAALLLLGVALRALDVALWRDVGGIVLLLGTVAVLLAATGSSGRRN